MHRFQVKEFGSFATIQTTWYIVRTLNCPSIIRPDDENFPSGPSSLSRSFELFQLAFVQTFQQHVRTPLSVRSTMRFLSKIQIWEDSCNCSNAFIHKASCAFKIQTSGRLSSWSWRASFRYENWMHQINRLDDRCYGSNAPSLDMEIACS
jgi:hypothetical protein